MVLKENKRIRLLKYLEIFRSQNEETKKKAQTHTTEMMKERESAREKMNLNFSVLYVCFLYGCCCCCCCWVFSGRYKYIVSTCHGLKLYSPHSIEVNDTIATSQLFYYGISLAFWAILGNFKTNIWTKWNSSCPSLGSFLHAFTHIYMCVRLWMCRLCMCWFHRKNVDDIFHPFDYKKCNFGIVFIFRNILF